jgi:hypothetical protein
MYAAGSKYSVPAAAVSRRPQIPGANRRPLCFQHSTCLASCPASGMGQQQSYRAPHLLWKFPTTIEDFLPRGP